MYTTITCVWGVRYEETSREAHPSLDAALESARESNRLFQGTACTIEVELPSGERIAGLDLL